ncbi:hypothetical protein [Maribacter sp. 2307ULW6-5]|uniref:hypothetical protein n=1 Tax=Maribacter sp. 2307ULW6-5 TaxID=3386275 RepID=UPI0039BD3452
MTHALQETKEDVLVFGSSRARNHYVPEVFEKGLNTSFFNTGKDGSYVFYQTAVLKAVLKRYRPKLIVYDFYGTLCYDQRDYDRLSVLLPYYKEHPEIRETLHLRGAYEPYKNVSRLYPFNSTVAIVAKGLLLNDSATDQEKGYTPGKGAFKNVPNLEFREPCPLDNQKVEHFKAFLSLCQAEKVPLVVVFSPVIHDNSDDFMVQTIKEICERQNTDFYDFSKPEAFPKEKKYFVDDIHLNESGSKLFSQKVVTLIKDKKLFE